MLTFIKNRVKNVQISKVEIVLLVLLLLFGIPMIVLIPPGAGYDEEDHLVRVWEMSAFSLIPGQMSAQEMQYPGLFRDFAYRQQGSTGVLRPEFWQRFGRASFYEYGVVHRELETKSVYSPALLFPQALTMRLLGRSANLPALPVFYACRFASLLSYLLLVWMAIRLIPFGKWILLVLAVSPMALFQATTLSPDAISNGIGFLFLAGCLKITKFEEIGWREFGSLVLLVFLLFLAKVNLIPLILLPFLLIPPARFSRRGMYILLLITTAILFLLEVAGWNLIASRYTGSLLANEANPVAQLQYVLQHPFAFLGTVIKDLPTHGWIYLQGWLNGYGYYYWTPPLIVALLFLLSLAAVVLGDSTLEQFNRKLRIVSLLVFLAGYLAIVLPLYATFTPVGADQVFGVQGRYFIPLVPLLFLVLASFPWLKKINPISRTWISTFLVATLLLNTAGIFLSFHVPCGSTFYQTGLCYRPLSKDFSSATHVSQPVSREISLVRELQVQCDGLAGLRIVLLPSGAGDKGITHFVLQNPVSGQTLLDTSIANDQIIAEDWYPFNFEPDWHSAGKDYILTISNTNSSAGQGLRFLYTPQSDFDLGEFYENGVPLEEDLVLQYGCATGLQKLWLTGKLQKP